MNRSRTRSIAAAACMVLLAWPGGTPRGEATRARIVEVVRKNPGIHKSELARLSGLSWGSINHHLRVLKRSGALLVDRNRSLVNLYPAETPAEQMRWIGLLGRADGPDLLGYIKANPGRGIQVMSQHYNVSRKIIRRHLARLEEVGMVMRSEDYRPKFFIREGAAGPVPPSAGRVRRLPAIEELDELAQTNR